VISLFSSSSVVVVERDHISECVELQPGGDGPVELVQIVAIAVTHSDM
jgi:hypothetical protein